MEWAETHKELLRAMLAVGADKTATKPKTIINETHWVKSGEYAEKDAKFRAFTRDAVKELVKGGLVERSGVGRGSKWALTSLGQIRAQSEREIPQIETLRKVAAAGGTTPPPQPSASFNSKGVKISDAPENQIKDPWLLKVASKQVACLGHFHSKAGNCKLCHIQSACRAEMLRRLEEMAERMMNPVQEKKPVEKKKPKYADIDMSNATKYCPGVDVKCDRCGGVMKAHVEGRMNVVTRQKWHLNCP